MYKSLNKNSSTLSHYEYFNNIIRYNKYKKIKKYLNSLDLLNNNCLELYNKPNQYILANSIHLYKQIGSDSVYGVIYKAKNINPKFTNIPIFTIKIQLDSSVLKTELNITNKLSIYGLKKKIPNLPIIYKSIDCYNIPKNSAFPYILTNNIKNSKKYTMIINELASGDLYSFLKDKYGLIIDDELWKNIYEQIFISILIIHSKRIKHNDTHDGNFLYHKIKPGGCFHYIINGTSYYIKNLGFIWTSWDYGLISELKNAGDYVYDYMEIIATMRKNDKSKITADYINHNFYYNYQWGYLNNSVNVSKKIQKLQIDLFELLGGYNNNNDIYQIENLKLTEDLFFKKLLDKDLLFSKEPKGTILTSVKIKLNTINNIK